MIQNNNQGSNSDIQIGYALDHQFQQAYNPTINNTDQQQPSNQIHRYRTQTNINRPITRNIDLENVDLRPDQVQQHTQNQHIPRSHQSLNVNTSQQLNINKYDLKNLPLYQARNQLFDGSVSDDTKQRITEIMQQAQFMRNDDSFEYDELVQEQPDQQQQSIEREQKTLKQCMVESAEYLIKILYLDSPRLIVSFILILCLTIIQLKYEIDKKCNLKDIYENRSSKNKKTVCPFDSFLILNLQNVFSFTCCNCMVCELLICMYQFQHRLMLQRIAVVLSIAQTFIDCYYQTIGNFRVITELWVLITVINFMHMIINNHNMGVQIQRYLQVVFYSLMMALIIMFNIQIRDNRNFYTGIIVQNIFYMFKKISYLYMQSRLKSNLQYDDIALFYIAVVAFDYVFIFEQLIVLNNSMFHQIIALLNFIIIQIQNITNKSIPYLVYEYFKKKNMRLFQGMIIFKYFMIVFTVFYNYLQQFINGLFIFVVYKYYTRFVQRFLSNDNIIAQRKEMEAIIKNKYFEQRIDESELDDFTCQQSVLAYYNFLIYQMLILAIEATQIPLNNAFSVQFQIVYRFEDNTQNNVSITNLIIFNIILMILMYMLIMVRSTRYLKSVKQPGKYQIFFYPFIGCTGVMCIIKSRLFEYGYTRQVISLW